MAYLQSPKHTASTHLVGDLKTQFMKDEYPTGKADLMTAFMVLAQELTVRGGTWAMINLPSWMSLKSFESMRLDLLKEQRIVSMVHLGRGIFGSDFGSVAFVIDNVAAKESRGTYRRLFEQHVDVRSVSAIESLFRDSTYNNYEVQQSDFAVIPGSPIVYWLSEKVRSVFTKFPSLASRSRSAKGLVTADNATFVRFWWEVSKIRTGHGYSSRDAARSSGRRWFPYAKGGEFRRWAGNLDAVIDWEQDGRRLQTTLTLDGSRVRATNFNLDRILKPAIAWTVVTSGEQSFRSVPPGSLFDAAAGMCQSDTDEAHLSVLNSSVASALLATINPTLNLHPGYLGALPIPTLNDSAQIQDLVRTLTRASAIDWNLSETSWDFERNPLVALA